ncbi:hypothetical protein OEA_29900 (plasmid) [Priestia megaterium NCT-2]|nr:hypothetical protein OEA_29900 [Priestia megaterium NCT-2]
MLMVINILTSCNRSKYFVRESIRLRTFILYRKPIIFIVHLSLKLNCERLLKTAHLYERF